MNTLHNTGIIIRGTRNIFLVLPQDKFNYYLQQKGNIPKEIHDNCIECRIKGKRGRIENTGYTSHNFLMAGDKVLFMRTDNNKGVIIESIERKNNLLRLRKNTHHSMAVNVDAILAVFSVKAPVFNAVFFDKILCLCRLEQVPMIATINKIDMLENVPKDMQMPEEIQNRIKILSEKIPNMIDFVYTSAEENIGINEIEEKMQGKLLAVLGQSGVGKSSLLNALEPALKRNVSELSVKYKAGRHTTTMPELCFASSYAIVDTPGMRDMVPSQLSASSVIIAYPELEDIAQDCKLPTCSHRTEPGCAIIKRVGNSILEERYKNYVRLRNEIEYVEKNNSIGQWN